MEGSNRHMIKIVRDMDGPDTHKEECDSRLEKIDKNMKDADNFKEDYKIGLQMAKVNKENSGNELEMNIESEVVEPSILYDEDSNEQVIGKEDSLSLSLNGGAESSSTTPRHARKSKTITRKRMLIEKESEEERKRRKELHFSILPGTPASDSKRKSSFLLLKYSTTQPLTPGTLKKLPKPITPPWERHKPSSQSPERSLPPSPHSPLSDNEPPDLSNGQDSHEVEAGTGSEVDSADELEQERDLGLDRMPSSAEMAPADMPPQLRRALAAMDAADELDMQCVLPPECRAFYWTANMTTFEGARDTFTGTPGPTFPTSELNTPLDAFLKIWDPQFVTTIVQETNRYAAKLLRSKLPSSSSVKSWIPTTVNEMYTFFGIMMYQSLISVTQELDLFYARDRIMAMPYFKEAISYDRLLILKKCLHFSNNEDMDRDLPLEKKRLYKIQPILNHLNSKFQTLYLPGQNIVIDDSLLEPHGHLTFIQKLAAKTTKQGIQSYELCDPASGYLWGFVVYAGAGAGAGAVCDSEPNDATAKVVYDLVTPLFHKGHTIIIDNVYSSPRLARSFKLENTDCFGTLRLNRENIPPSIKSVSKMRLRTGDVFASTSGDVNIVVWKDSYVVGLISTYHEVEVGAAEKYGRWQYRPQVVLDYNASMGQVDKRNQLLSSYPLERRMNSVWYKKVFGRLMNASILNAFVLYKHKDSKIDHRQFRMQLARELIEKFKPIDQIIEQPRAPSPDYSIMPSPKPVRPILRGNHFSVKIEETPVSRQCVWCKMNNIRAETIRQCDVCEVPLCVDCMKPYHSV